jgi:hypothetical protein
MRLSFDDPRTQSPNRLVMAIAGSDATFRQFGDQLAQGPPFV